MASIGHGQASASAGLFDVELHLVDQLLDAVKLDIPRKPAVEVDTDAASYRSWFQSSTCASIRRCLPSKVGVRPNGDRRGTQVNGLVGLPPFVEEDRTAGVHPVGWHRGEAVERKVRGRKTERTATVVAMFDDAIHAVRTPQCLDRQCQLPASMQERSTSN